MLHLSGKALFMPLEPCALRSNVKRGCDLRIVANVFEQPRQRKETMTLPSCLAFLHLKGKIQNGNAYRYIWLSRNSGRFA